MLEQKHDQARLRNATYQKKAAYYFDKKVKEKGFRVREVVLRRVFLNTKEVGAGILVPT